MGDVKVHLQRKGLMRRKCLVWWSVALGAGILGVVLMPLKPRSNVQLPWTSQATMEVPASLTPTDRPARAADSGASMSTATARRAVDAPPWAIAYGKEFWRRPIQSSTPKPATALLAHVDLADVMERVSHAFEADTNSVSSVVRAQAYAARFDG